MQRSPSRIIQWISSLVGLLAIGLLLGLPAFLPDQATVANAQSQVSVLKSTQQTDQSDWSPTLFTDAHRAFIRRPQTSFTFSLTPACLFSATESASPVWVLQFRGRVSQSFFSFRFVRLLFEHQIAINAP